MTHSDDVYKIYYWDKQNTMCAKADADITELRTFGVHGISLRFERSQFYLLTQVKRALVAVHEDGKRSRSREILFLLKAGE